ncbi:BH3542 [Halalkalibacterium halodurans C-125]|uniref:BH3542 protein n=1 Tax=Halalkalibacterium halodurans (strain ATCC BAA-125 / DSM 18197 / FERM 7344 / JCM 9153 / C-125) TaxID=272558 RepID=Q9K731_HALH5|nr:DnaD domain-containing protein [Halalkalibacterium halodurans]BAB07261.1 BH3542 [Halalkalibacterium halodurans C-125]
MEGNFFLVYRKIFHHEIFRDQLGFRLFMLILGNAVFSQDGVEIDGVVVKRGQWFRSYRKLQEDLAYREGRTIKKPGLATLKRAVKRLEDLDMIKTTIIYENGGTRCGTGSGTVRGTLFEVVNYAKYQALPGPENLLRNAMRNASRNKNNNVLNNNELNNKATTTTGEEPVTFYESNFGMLSPFQMEQIVMMREENSDELVLAAMKLALKKNKKHLSYVEGILKIWRENNVKTVADARAYELEYRNRLQVVHGGVKNGSKVQNNRRSYGSSTKTDGRDSISFYEPGKWDNVDLDDIE